MVIDLDIGGKTAEQTFLLDGSHVLFLPLGRESECAGGGINALHKMLLVALLATNGIPEVVLIIVALDVGQHFSISFHCVFLLNCC